VERAGSGYEWERENEPERLHEPERLPDLERLPDFDLLPDLDLLPDFDALPDWQSFTLGAHLGGVGAQTGGRGAHLGGGGGRHPPRPPASAFGLLSSTRLGTAKAAAATRPRRRNAIEREIIDGAMQQTSLLPAPAPTVMAGRRGRCLRAGVQPTCPPGRPADSPSPSSGRRGHATSGLAMSRRFDTA
jgi:hypothetical protein